MDTYPEREPQEYLGSLETLEHASAIVHRAMDPTPQYAWPLLCEALGTQVWAKHENHTPVGAFKLRGGLVYFDELARSLGKPAGVISATRGNHGSPLHSPRDVAACRRPLSCLTATAARRMPRCARWGPS